MIRVCVVAPVQSNTETAPGGVDGVTPCELQPERVLLPRQGSPEIQQHHFDVMPAVATDSGAGSGITGNSAYRGGVRVRLVRDERGCAS